MHKNKLGDSLLWDADTDGFRIRARLSYSGTMEKHMSNMAFNIVWNTIKYRIAPHTAAIAMGYNDVVK
jgi:hypothetical protein